MLALLFALIPAQAVEPGSVAFIELEAGADRVWVEEPFSVRIRFGFERAFAEERLVELFRRALDVPAQVQADWLDDLAGAEELGPFRPPRLEQRPRSFALGDDVAHAELALEERDGRSFSVLSIEREFVVGRAGVLTVPGPMLRFQYAASFDEDLFGDRAARGVQEAQVVAEPLEVDVRRWPEDGRPYDFTGAIGTFALEIEVEPRELAVGDDLSVVLTIQGEGNLGRFDVPRYEPEGFVLRGRTLESRADALIVRLGLAPDTVVGELPPMTLPVLDPVEGSYRRLRTEPVALVVRPVRPVRPDGAVPAARAERAAPAVEEGPVDRALDETDSAVGFVAGFVVGVVLLVGSVVVARSWWRSRSARSSVRPSAALARARRSVDAALQDSESMLEARFTEYLAAVLDVAPAAVAGRDLVGRLERRGVPSGLAGRLAAAYDDVVHAHWSGGGAGSDVDGMWTLLDEVDSAVGGSG